MYGMNGLPSTPITPSTANFFTTSMPLLVAKAVPSKNPRKNPWNGPRYCGFRSAITKTVSRRIGRTAGCGGSRLADSERREGEA